MNKQNNSSYLENRLKFLAINYLTGEETVLWPSWGSNNVTVSYNKLYYILEGDFYFEINGKIYHGKPGQMFLLPSGCLHSYHAYHSKNARKMWMHFTAPCGEKDFFERIDMQPFITVHDPAYVERLFHTAFHCKKQGGFGDVLRVKSAVLELLGYYLDEAEINVPCPVLDERFEQVIRYIDAHIAEEIRLKDLAQLMYLTSNYFIKYFKKQVGVSPMEYILTTRIDLAKQYLQSENIPIKDIALKCGFSSLYYFDRVFKRHTGITPTNYRHVALGTHQASDNRQSKT